MASFNIQINSNPNKDGLYSLFVRVTEKRKNKLFKLDFRIPEEHFNRKAKYGKWIRTSNPKHAFYNKEIESAWTKPEKEFQNYNLIILMSLDTSLKKKYRQRKSRLKLTQITICIMSSLILRLDISVS